MEQTKRKDLRFIQEKKRKRKSSVGIKFSGAETTVSPAPPLALCSPPSLHRPPDWAPVTRALPQQPAHAGPTAEGSLLGGGERRRAGREAGRAFKLAPGVTLSTPRKTCARLRQLCLPEAPARRRRRRRRFVPGSSLFKSNVASPGSKHTLTVK